MPIQQLAPPTISEVSQEIALFEERYGIRTAEFIEAESPNLEIDEDDAVEWLYLVEQRKALQEDAVVHSYSHTEVGKALKNCHSVMDRLAA